MAECWAAALISSLYGSWDCFWLLSFTAYCFSNSSNVCLSLDSWDLCFWSYSLPFPSLPGNPLWVGCVREHRLISIFILFMLTKEETGCCEGVSGHCSGLSISMEKQEEEGAGYTSVFSVNPLEPALLHRWTSLKVKTFPHQGFVKENGCIFLRAIIFILLSVLESNPHKPSASGLMGLSGCWAGMELGSALGADCLPLLEGGTKHPDHQTCKNRVKARAGSMPGQGGYLDHSRDLKGNTLAYS